MALVSPSRLIHALCALTLAGVAPLAAQEQEKTVQDKLFGKPDMSLEYVPRSLNGKSLVKEFKAPSARVRPFLFRQKFSGKEFKTEEFRSKAYEAPTFYGQKEFATRDALSNWRTNASSKTLLKDAPGLKPYETADAQDSGKQVPTGQRTYDTTSKTDEPMRGKSQEDLDQTYKERPALTIDQVRELLNKND